MTFRLITVGILACLLFGCGMDLKNPDGQLSGTGPYEISYELTGSDGLTEAAVITRDSDGNLLHGTLNEDGSVTGESVSLPWTFEHTSPADEEEVYFYVYAVNGETDLLASGTVSSYRENRIIDGSASFSSNLSVGDYLYNKTDDVVTTVESINSDTDISLRHVPYGEDWRTYYIYQRGTTVVYGTCDSPAANKLYDTDFDDNTTADTDASFTTKVTVGDLVANNTDAAQPTTTVTSVDDDDELTLAADIFTNPGDRYLISLDSSITGNADSDVTGHLVDSGATFEVDGVFTGLLAEETGTPAYAQITAVSNTDLTLDKDIFPLGTEAYRVYLVKSSANYSTTYGTDKLIDSNASFYSTVKEGDIIYNPTADLYGAVDSVDSDTVLSFSVGTEVFPEHAIEYEVYSPRTLTLTVYVDGEEHASTSSEHWDAVEVSLSGMVSGK